MKPRQIPLCPAMTPLQHESWTISSLTAVFFSCFWQKSQSPFTWVHSYSSKEELLIFSVAQRIPRHPNIHWSLSSLFSFYLSLCLSSLSTSCKVARTVLFQHTSHSSLLYFGPGQKYLPLSAASSFTSISFPRLLSLLKSLLITPFGRRYKHSFLVEHAFISSR